MENAVPAMFGKPILIRVSLQYRFTSITVDPQVETVNGELFDVLYVGTGKKRCVIIETFTNNEHIS